VAGGIVLVILFGIPGAAVAAVSCGTARPGLGTIATAEGLVIAPEGTIYFSQPFVGANQQYLKVTLGHPPVVSPLADAEEGILRLFRHDTPGLEVPWHRPAPAAASATPSAPPQIALPGQYASAPADWRFPVWPNGCNRFSGDDKVACLQFVATDYGRLSRYAAANAALAPKRPGEKRVVFFGDSITDNWSKAGYGGFFPGRPYVNRGIGGQTTSQMLLRFRPDVIALQPDVVVVLAGTNDIAGNAGAVSLEVVEQNLATMAELAKLHGIRVVLASLLPVSDDKRDTAGRPVLRTKDRPPATLRALNAWMSDHARRNGHVYLDYFTAAADSSGVLKPELNDDGLHPNAAGYAAMAPLAEKAIARALSGRP
jgi:lysophospholipase L1-like esterase